MVSTGVGKMNLQGPKAGMQLEEDLPVASLWSGNRRIRAVTLGKKNGGRKKRQKQKCTNRKPVTTMLRQPKDFPAAARAVSDFEKEG